MRGTVAVLLFVVTFSAGAASATEWRMLTDRSRLEFIVDYSGQEAPGLFRKFDVDLQFDPATPADGRLIVTVATLSADMDSADINEAIAAPEWFDFVRFADAQFVSDSIAVTENGQYVATGRLQLKGIEQGVDVPFTWSQAGGVVHMRGELVLQRGAFTIGSGEWAAPDIIGENVRVRFDVVLESDVE